MFKKLKKLFRKEQEIVSAITLYTDNSGETFVDVRMKDDSDESIDHLSSILLMFDASSFFQVSSVLKQQCKNNNNDELYVKVIQSIVAKAGPEKLLTDYKHEDDNLCINPSDMI
tara:strand:- start:4233 stop:4574 length:342 start_codon:yes stop_codon:yes gene_type:complete